MRGIWPPPCWTVLSLVQEQWAKLWHCHQECRLPLWNWWSPGCHGERKPTDTAEYGKKKVWTELSKWYSRNWSFIWRTEKKEAHVEFAVIPHSASLTDRRGEIIQLCPGRKHIWTDGNVLQQTLRKSTKKDGNHLKQVFSYSETASSGRTPQVEPIRKCKGAPDPEAWEVTNAGITCQVTEQRTQLP